MRKKHLLIIGGWTKIFNKAFKIGFDVSYIGSCKQTKAFDVSVLKNCINSQNIETNGVGIL